MSNRKIIRRYFVICFVLLCQNLYSQTVLRGIVLDDGGELLGSGAEPVVNARVRLTDQSDTSRSFTTYTDEQGRWSIQITPTEVNDHLSEPPAGFQLLQNYPNPFNPSTVISFNLPRPSEVRLAIYNLRGKKIKTLIDGYQPARTGHVIWNATDDFDRAVPAGVYIYSMQTNTRSINRKMLLLHGQQGSTTIQQVAKTEAGLTDHRDFNKHMSVQFLLQVTGEDIAAYEQKDLDIPGTRYMVVTVARTVTDIDGNVYKTVKIGDQWWMAENLEVTHYQNGDAIPNVTGESEWARLSTGAYCNYGNNAETYGRLYNWHAVNDSRNIVPAGWHVPTDEEWKRLKMALGMSQSEADEAGWRGTNEGSKMAGNADLWPDGSLDNDAAFGESGFSAIPGGLRTYIAGYFGNLGYRAYFWSSSESNSIEAWYNELDYHESNVYRNDHDKRYGYSVRGVRD